MTTQPRDPRMDIRAGYAQRERATRKPSVSNVGFDFRENKKGKPERVLLHIPIEKVGSGLLEATGQWPKVAGGLPFSVGRRGSVRYLGKPDEFFAWLHEETTLYWSHSNEAETEAGDAATPASKSEFFAHIKDAAEQYQAVSDLPHYPKMDGVYYMPSDLPPPTGERLAEFVAAINPETEQDRGLMLALLLTMGWGGEPGTRPAFVIDSAHGKGAGKTATARVLTSVWGGAFRASRKDDWPQTCKRLMSSNKRNTRAILIDNVKGVFGGEDIESALTSETIGGWQNYLGEVYRPNDIVLIVTANKAELSSDLTPRSVVIHVGKPKHGANFVRWASAFVREHQLQLISDCLAMLAGPSREAITHRDRWDEWQDGVLAKIPGANALAALIISRRPALDSEAEDREAWSELVFEMCVAKNGGGGGGGRICDVTAYDIHQAAVKAGLWQPDKARGAAHDRQHCVKRAERLLNGTNIIVPVENDDGTKKLARVYGDNNEVAGKSRVYRLTPPADGSVVVVPDAELPPV